MNKIGAAAAANENESGQPMRIGEMAKEFGVTLRALRFYEDKGLLQPQREGTTRLYSRRDQARLKLVLFGRRLGFSLRDVKQMIDLYEPGSNAKQLRVVLDKSEKQLARLEKQRDTLAEAIEELRSNVGIWRQELGGKRTASDAG